nr:hypothetical protein [Tanacetum cinerariifolium]
MGGARGRAYAIDGGICNPVNAASTLGTFSAGGPTSPHSNAFIPFNTLLHVNQDDSQILDLEDTAELQSTDGTQKVSQALDDESRVEAMQEELLTEVAGVLNETRSDFVSNLMIDSVSAIMLACLVFVPSVYIKAAMRGH